MIEVSKQWLLVLFVSILLLQVVVYAMDNEPTLGDNLNTRVILYALMAVTLGALILPYIRAVSRSGAEEVLSTSRTRGKSRVEDLCYHKLKLKTMKKKH